MKNKDDLLPLVAEAQKGAAEAVEALIVAIQGRIFGIAIKIFWNPQDAQEATQEALIRIVTKIDSFKGESSFSTWSHRVAVNHFLNLKKKKEIPISFETFEKTLESGLNERSPNIVHDPILVSEAKIGCSLGMLQCLDRLSRIIYVLGEVLEFSSSEGAFIVDISEVDFRQRLHRARDDLHGFMQRACGLVSKNSKCRCVKQVAPAIQSGLIKRKALLFSDFATPDEIYHQVEGLMKEAEVFHLTDVPRRQLNFASHVRKILKTR